MRELRVTGRGKVVAVPDRIVLNINLKGKEKEYKKAYEQMEISTKEIREVVQEVSLNAKDLKTKKCEIEVKNSREYNEKKKTWIPVFEGYEFVHNMAIEFDKDNALLGKILHKLSKCKSRPEVDINYTVNDIEEVKKELLKNAIADSNQKAIILAEAAGVSLGEIIKIDYSWGEINFTSSKIDSFLDVLRLSDEEDYEDDFFDMDIEPEDINITDTVTVIWRIE